MKLRISNHKLMIETGRYDKTPHNDRFCLVCNSGIIEDIFRFLLHCPKYSIPKERFYNQIQHNFVDFQLSCTYFKQLLDEVFVISGIIKVEVGVISRSRRLRLITLTETLIFPDITKTESNNCFIIHCFEENNDKRIIAAITVYFQTLKNVQLID